MENPPMRNSPHVFFHAALFVVIFLIGYLQIPYLCLLQLFWRQPIGYGIHLPHTFCFRWSTLLFQEKQRSFSKQLCLNPIFPFFSQPLSSPGPISLFPQVSVSALPVRTFLMGPFEKRAVLRSPLKFLLSYRPPVMRGSFSLPVLFGSARSPGTVRITGSSPLSPWFARFFDCSSFDVVEFCTWPSPLLCRVSLPLSRGRRNVFFSTDEPFYFRHKIQIPALCQRFFWPLAVVQKVVSTRRIFDPKRTNALPKVWELWVPNLILTHPFRV